MANGWSRFNCNELEQRRIESEANGNGDPASIKDEGRYNRFGRLVANSTGFVDAILEDALLFANYCVRAILNLRGCIPE